MELAGLSTNPLSGLLGEGNPDKALARSGDMSVRRPLITIITPTYNRGHLVTRAIDSVFAQGFDDWHLVIVDDGSTDNTREVLEKYDDPRIEVVYHSENKGVTAAKNTGFNYIRGDWFTILDSDDELLPNMLAEMLQVPERIDPRIDAVIYNCVDTTTGGFSGFGLDHDQYVSFEEDFGKRYGQFFGITKSSLLGDLRFNESIPGGEQCLWMRIEQCARKYYVHKAAKKYFTDGKDRVMLFNRKRFLEFHRHIVEEKDYLDALRLYRPEIWRKIMSLACMVKIIDGNREQAREMLKDSFLFNSRGVKILCEMGLVIPPSLFKWLILNIMAIRAKRK